jgi:uncharacterized protein
MTDAGKRTTALHFGVFFALFAAVFLAFPRIGWPWHFIVPFGLYALLVRVVPRLGATVPPWRLGKLHGTPLGFAVLVAVGSASVLLWFDDIYLPKVDDLAAGIPLTLLGSAGLASVVFAVVNAVCEELAFRWLAWEAVAEEWNRLAALLATAVLFGIAHLHGYPPGPLGAALATLYGLTLGILRWWTGGLGLAIACHVVADFTIFVILSSRTE